MPKIAVIIEDDWELRGDGSGNVAAHQYLPARFLMDTAGQLGIKVTFMVEVLQQLKYIQFSEVATEFRLQSRLWHDTVAEMCNRGFDVQLHLHPQWYSASLEGAGPKLESDWNIGLFARDKQEEMVSGSLSYLRQLFSDCRYSREIIAYKAGNWGMQPSESLLEILENNGIRWVLGVCKDLWVPDQNTDYREIDEDTFPYVPAPEDVRRKKTGDGAIKVIPLAYAYLNMLDVTHTLVLRYAKKLAYSFATTSPIETEYFYSNGGNKKRVFRGLKIANHVQLGNLPFSVMKSMFDSTYRRLSDLDAEVVPMVIESHTKTFLGNYKNIEKFLRYIVDHYGSKLEFHDITSYDRLVTTL